MEPLPPHSMPIRQSGFTLIEVMVVVALVATLAGLATPSFLDAFRRYRVDAARENLSSSINLARVEAIRRSVPVVLARINACSTALTAVNDWSCGWTVFADLDSTNSFTAGDVLIQTVNELAQTNVFKNNIVSPQTLTLNSYGQVTQLGQRFSFFAVGQTALEGQLLCFTTGTRVRTVKKATVCPAT